MNHFIIVVAYFLKLPKEKTIRIRRDKGYENMKKD